MFDYLINPNVSGRWNKRFTSIPKLNGEEEVYNHQLKLEDWFNEGKYMPYSDEDLIDLAVRVKKKWLIKIKKN